MQRAIQLKATAEAEGGYAYDLVVVSRWDVLWQRPIALSKLQLTPETIALPTFCTAPNSMFAKASDGGQHKRAYLSWRSNVCGGQPVGLGAVPTAAGQCGGGHRPCMPDLSLRAREIYLLDWWFITSSRNADVFGRVADEDAYANYTLLNSHGLNAQACAQPEDPITLTLTLTLARGPYSLWS